MKKRATLTYEFSCFQQADLFTGAESSVWLTPSRSNNGLGPGTAFIPGEIRAGSLTRTRPESGNILLLAHYPVVQPEKGNDTATY